MIPRKAVLFLAALCFVIGTLFTRPMLLAQNQAPLSLVFFSFGLLIAGFASPLKINHRNLMIVSMILIYWSYIVAQSYLSGANYNFALRAFFLITGAVFSISIFFSIRGAHNIYFKLLVSFIIFECISYSITMLFSVVIPLDRLLLIDFPVEGYLNAGRIYFPLTFVYGTLDIFNMTIPRLSAGFRESGITQAFIIWAYFTLPQVNLNRWYNRFILVIGLFGTLSTLAIPLFIFLSFFASITKKNRLSLRRLGLLISLPLIFWVAYRIGFLLPEIGIQAKLSTASIQDRWTITSAALTALQANPFGSGAFGGTDVLQGINLVAWFGQIGLPGIFLLAMVYLAVLWSDHFNPRKILLLLPLLVTWLISQPLYDSPLLFILLFQLPASTTTLHDRSQEEKMRMQALPTAVPGKRSYGKVKYSG